MDEKVFRFVAHTGFTHFEKGILWHERMYVFSSVFPAPFSFPTQALVSPFDSDKLLGTGLFNACVILMLLLIAFMLSLLQRRKSVEDRASHTLLLSALHPNSHPSPHSYVPRAAKSPARSSQRNASPT